MTQPPVTGGMYCHGISCDMQGALLHQGPMISAYCTAENLTVRWTLIAGNHPRRWRRPRAPSSLKRSTRMAMTKAEVADAVCAWCTAWHTQDIPTILAMDARAGGSASAHGRGATMSPVARPRTDRRWSGFSGRRSTTVWSQKTSKRLSRARGVAWGIFREAWQDHGHPPEQARVCFSKVLIKSAQGAAPREGRRDRHDLCAGAAAAAPAADTHGIAPRLCDGAPRVREGRNRQGPSGGGQRLRSTHRGATLAPGERSGRPQPERGANRVVHAGGERHDQRHRETPSGAR
jgi:hypothetical protein